MNLPQVYGEIADRAGLDAALGLARARGGQRVYVPKDPRIAPWMAEAMGDAGAKALVDMYGGEAIDLPVDPLSGNSPQARARRIALAMDAGISVNEIVRAEGLSRRQVYWIAAKNRKAKNRAAKHRGAAEIVNTPLPGPVETVTIPAAEYAGLLAGTATREKRRRPCSRIDASPEMQAFIIARLGKISVRQISAECRRAFGSDGTGKSSIERFATRCAAEQQASKPEESAET